MFQAEISIHHAVCISVAAVPIRLKTIGFWGLLYVSSRWSRCCLKNIWCGVQTDATSEHNFLQFVDGFERYVLLMTQKKWSSFVSFILWFQIHWHSFWFISLESCQKSRIWWHFAHCLCQYWRSLNLNQLTGVSGSSLESMRLSVLAHQLEMTLTEEELTAEPYCQAIISGKWQFNKRQ